MRKLYTLLITPEATETACFYQEYFGFVAVFEQGWYVQLRHEASGVELEFMLPHVEKQPEELHPGFTGTGLVFSFETDDARADDERLQQTDITFVHAPRDEEWGQRHFIVRDPSGVSVDVVQQLSHW